MRTSKKLAALTTATALVTAALAVAPSADAALAQPKAIPHSAPLWLAKTKSLGHASASAKVSARVYLAPRGGLAALAATATALSTPGSSTYGHFLTAAQYNAKYTPTTATVKQVSSWLASSGFTVSKVAAHNQYLSISGNVRAVKKAFGADVDVYHHNGATVHAPASALKAPTALAANVLAVTGVDTSVQKVTPASAGPDAAPPAGFYNGQPCSKYYGQLKSTYQADYSTPLPKFAGKSLPFAVCGYTGPQLRAAYEGYTPLTGSGVSVAIIDAYAANTIAADASKYAIQNGDGSYAPGQFTQTKLTPFTHTGTGPTGCGENGWYGEETLDVEAVHAMAPEADIHYYGASSCYDSDFIDALSLVVQDDAVQVATNSWGDVEQNESSQNVAAYESVFLQGAVEGITFTFSSGDNGDELANTGIRQADYPTSDPYVTSVGGTSAAIGSTGSLIFQASWGTHKYSLSSNGKAWNPVGYLYGSGGGNSALFPQPAYQKYVAPGPARQVPDVAMDADPTTGMLVGETQVFGTKTIKYGEYRIGGTSLASPLFAGMTALKIQNTGHAFGLLNPTVYSNTKEFTDIVGSPRDVGNVRVDYANGVNPSDGILYSVRTFGQDSSLTAHKGWDDTTGVGTPNSAWLAAGPAPAS
ncbi:S53 family peptidase [Jatrophihabitans sp.]|uniref:S53 family peptidase n=1 Tax=Jatrophihabitans sp. TaxID=1932789 RepID=UPI0030C6AF86|nr:physarolisin [Jatrophihabitans sp.]